MQVISKILSMTAAPPGWYSVFRNEDGTMYRSPVAMWLLVEDRDVNGRGLPLTYADAYCEQEVCFNMRDTESNEKFVGWIQEDGRIDLSFIPVASGTRSEIGPYVQAQFIKSI